MAEPLTIPSRPILRRFWNETHSVQQVAERTGISLARAHELLVAMLAEEENS
jgi:DNA-binding IclR family transcriptional regulator